jgi:tripartite-type tricarboxylate transporter receptor subunit TctC
MRRTARLSTWGMLGCVLALVPIDAFAQSRVSVIIGYPPGAIYDLYARTVAKHFGRHLPGQPSVIPQNMAGAGSLRAANYLYNVAPKDGSTIGLFARGMAMQPLLDEAGIEFDAQKFSWLGSASSEVSVVLARASTPFKTIEDARNREMVLAASGSGADSVIFPYILNGIIGTKFKVVTGYPGNADMLLAVERGEVDGNAGTSWTSLVSIRPGWIQERKINILLQMAGKKHPDLGHVPLALELARDESDRTVLELIFSRQDMAYPFVAPPGIAAERLQALRQAFDATMTDAEFLADAKKQNLDVDPVRGREIEAIIRKTYATPAAVIARARAVLQSGKAITTSK